MCRVLTQTANHNAARSRRATAVSPGGNFSFNLNLSRYTGCREQFFFQKNKNTNHIKQKKTKKTRRYMDFVHESRATVALSRVQLRTTGDTRQATRDISYHLSRDKK